MTKEQELKDRLIKASKLEHQIESEIADIKQRLKNATTDFLQLHDEYNEKYGDPSFLY